MKRDIPIVYNMLCYRNQLMIRTETLSVSLTLFRLGFLGLLDAGGGAHCAPP